MTTNDPSRNAPKGPSAKQGDNQHNAEKLVAVDNFKDHAQFAQSFDNGFHPASTPQDSGGMCRADGASTPLPTPASDSCHHDSSRDSGFPLAVPPTPSAAEAFRILADAISHPGKIYHPTLAVAAWCRIKFLRGQPISDQRLERLGVEVQTLDRSAIEQATREQRIREKARSHAAQRGYDGPSPLILPGATA